MFFNNSKWYLCGGYDPGAQDHNIRIMLLSRSLSSAWHRRFESCIASDQESIPFGMLVHRALWPSAGPACTKWLCLALSVVEGVVLYCLAALMILIRSTPLQNKWISRESRPHRKKVTCALGWKQIYAEVVPRFENIEYVAMWQVPFVIVWLWIACLIVNVSSASPGCMQKYKTWEWGRLDMRSLCKPAAKEWQADTIKSWRQ